MENSKCVSMAGATNFTLREDLSALLFAVGSSCNVPAISFPRLRLTSTFHIDILYNITLICVCRSSEDGTGFSI